MKVQTNDQQKLEGGPKPAESLEALEKPSTWKRFVEWVWTNPEYAEPFIRRKLRAFFRVIIIVFHEFIEDRIALRASALTFTVILSLVPMLALGTAVLKGFGGGGQLRQAAYTFIETLELTQTIEQNTGASTEAYPAGSPSIEKNAQPPLKPEKISEDKIEETLTIHLRRAVDIVFDYVERTNFATLGAIGILGLLLTVIAFLSSIEQSLNVIWQSKSGRPVSRQIMNYLGLMILLPLAVYLAFATMATLKSPTLLAKIEKTLPLSWLGFNLFKLLPILAVAATFTIIYKYLPSSFIRMSSALTGGIVGGLGWIMVQSLYLRVQFGVARYNAIYGSFATLPLFLLWIYVAWIIFLTGAEVSFATQSWERYQRKKIVLTPIVKLAIAFDIIETALADFKDRKTSNPINIAQRLRQPEKFIAEVLDMLISGGIMRRVSEEEDEYLPAAPAEEIQPAEVVDLVLGMEAPKMRGSSLAMLVLNGGRDALRNKKIGRGPLPTAGDKEQNQ